MRPWQDELHQGPDLHVVEAFAGVGRVGQAFRGAGLRAAFLDAGMDEGLRGVHDLLSSRGFIAALQLVRRLVPGGILVGGPPCASWTAVRLPVEIMNTCTSLAVGHGRDSQCTK